MGNSLLTHKLFQEDYNTDRLIINRRESVKKVANFPKSAMILLKNPWNGLRGNACVNIERYHIARHACPYIVAFYSFQEISTKN